MNFVKKHKAKIIASVCIIAVLAIYFICGGSNTNNTHILETDESTSLSNTSELTRKAEKSSAPEAAEKPITIAEETQLISKAPEVVAESLIPQDANTETIKVPTVETEASGIEDDSNIKTYEHNAEPEPELIPVPSESGETEFDSNELTCTLSIRCENAVRKSAEKAKIIPDNGIIFAEQKVVFYEGESVFNVLVREMKKHKIHLEFVNIPFYNSAYIEGIGNLYEFDCGELSGWMYKVNNLFPNYGCSLYELKNGDKVEWVYTCDLGKDVGGEYSQRNGMQNE